MTAVFTPEQVHEILRLHRKGKPVHYITDRYGHLTTVRNIVLGQVYRDVMHRADRTCQCCVVGDRRERNMDVARPVVFAHGPTVDVVIECPPCGAQLSWPAGKVVRAHGALTCPKCDGRKKK